MGAEGGRGRERERVGGESGREEPTEVVEN